MFELGISQVQAQFIKLLTQTVFIVGKDEGSFNEFVGILDNNFVTDDEKYKAIVK